MFGFIAPLAIYPPGVSNLLFIRPRVPLLTKAIGKANAVEVFSGKMTKCNNVKTLKPPYPKRRELTCSLTPTAHTLFYAEKFYTTTKLMNDKEVSLVEGPT
jgi:hypothetical protein